MKRKILWPLAVFLLLAVVPQTVYADGIIIPAPPICDPGSCPLEPLPLSQLEIRYHFVDVIINDQVAHTHIEQVFYNPNDWTVEGVYVFPIPRGATVTEFKLWIDGEPVQGVVLDAEEARQTYEEIVRKMKDPALLEYAEQGALQARIFPIPPKGERRIELDYSEVISSENGLIRYVYPLNTEKFSTKPLDEVRVNLEIVSSSPIRAAYSPSHEVDVVREGNHQLTVGYEELGVRPDIDFAFHYSIGENEAFHLLSFRDPGEEFPGNGFFTMLLAPRPDAGTNPLAKDVILVLDRSGSMDGDKFYQAQDAMRYILNHLNGEDQFNIISFSTGIKAFASSMQPVSAQKEALAWVNRLSAAGSTDINLALLESVAMSDKERPTYLIFLTDGLPTEGVVDPVEILNNLSRTSTDNLRLFAFGVGYDVDTFLLDSLAEGHHGSSTYVLPGEPIDEILSGFYARISIPVLTDLKIDFGEIEVFDLYPSPIPDLFEGDQIVVVGRYREGGVTDVILQGKINQEKETIIFKDQVFVAEGFYAEGQDTNLQYIPRLWATRKIGHLLKLIRLEGPEQEIIDQVVNLSIRYGIVTPYTSYLVTESAPLGAAEQERIAEEQYEEMKSAQDAPSYGRAAVEEAAGQGEMEHSDLATSPHAELTNEFRVVGSRSFISSEGMWVDTAYDQDNMETLKVPFLSDDYFTLVASRQNLADAFALGPRVIAISEGIAYEVVEEDTPVEAINIPDPHETEDIIETEGPLETIEAEEVQEVSQVDEPLQDETPALENGTIEPTQMIEIEMDPADPPASNKSEYPIPCLGGLFPLVLISLGSVVFGGSKRKDEHK